MYTGIEHTAIATTDPEALAAWYVKTLGWRIAHRYGGNVFVRAQDGAMLEMIPSEGPAVETGVKTPGIRHLAISVSDYNAAVKDIESKGIEIFARVDADGNRLSFFRDLDGNILHLIDRDQQIT